MSTERLERSYTPLGDAKLEVRAVEEDTKQPKLSGYPIVYNVLSSDLGGFRERILPGAFDDSLANADIRLLKDHQIGKPLARVGNNTLRLQSDEIGIRMDAEPNINTSAGRDTVALVQRKDVTGMSFGFRVTEDRYLRGDDGDIIKEVVKGELLEISVVTFPAYAASSVSVRTMEKVQSLKNERDEKNEQNKKSVDTPNHDAVKERYDAWKAHLES